MAHPFNPTPDDALLPLDRPHDALFRLAFGRIEHARSVLRALLPAALAQHIDWTTLHVESATFVDDALSRSESDLLFSVELDGERTYLYLLVEHQSSPDRAMNHRLVRYQADIWQRWHAEGHGPDELPPPILPIVLAHGERPWPYPTQLMDTVRLDAATRAAFGRLLLDGDLILIDLARLSLESLERLTTLTEFACLVLVALKVARTSDDLARDLVPFAARFRKLARDHGRGRRDLGSIFRYIHSVNRSPTEPLQEALRQHVGPEAEEVFVTSAQQLLAEGRRDGRADTLVRQLERKFGPLDAATRQRIRGATTEELEACLDRFVFAVTLADVFAADG